MSGNRYTAKYFRENLPEWKRKKDSLLVRYLFRPVSFHSSSIAANLGIGANAVSYFSMIVAIIGSLMFVFSNVWTNIVGAVLILFWMLLDCTDGNLSRCVRKEPFGEFADAASSYVLVFFLFSSLGIAAYRSNGLLLLSGEWFILALGIFGGGSDSLARLLYQKFENTRIKNSNESISVNSDKNEQGKLVKIHDRIDKEIGLNGLFLPALLVCSIFWWFDIFVAFYSMYFIASLLATIFILVHKARKVAVLESNK